MKTLLAALVAAPLLFTGVAAAERPLGEGQYVRAARCVAYASLPALRDNAVDLSAVEAKIAASRARQSAMTRLEARNIQRDAQLAGERADSAAEVEELLTKRDRYCTAFVDATQLAARAESTSRQ